MNQEQFLGIVRNLLIPLSAFAAAHGIAAGTWDGIVGLIGTGAFFAWAIYQHDATIDILQSFVRSAIGAVGGFMLQKGWISSDQVTLWTAAFLSLVPSIWTWFVHADPSAVPTPPKASLAFLGALAGSYKIVAAITLMGTLSGCAAISTLTTATVSPTQVSVAINGFIAAEATAKNYILLPTCPQAAPVCKTAQGVKNIDIAVRSARKASTAITNYAISNGAAAPVPVSLFDALTTSVTSLNSALTQYNAPAPAK